MCVLTLTPSTAAGAEVSIGDFQLRFVAPDRETNIVDITINGLAYDVVDARAPLRAGPGCTAETQHYVRCSGLVFGVRADLGTGNDDLIAAEVGFPVDVQGGLGDDFVVGGKQADSIAGGSGDDTLDGSTGEDRLIGEDGSDAAIGGDDADLLDGGPGGDYLRGRDGDDVALGGPGDDLAAGGAGDDTLNGQSGADGVFDSLGSNRLEGGPDDDIISASGEQQTTVDCGLGSDRLATGGVSASTGCDTQTTGVPYPRRWPPHRDGGVPASASCHVFDICPKALDVVIHKPRKRSRYFRARVDSGHWDFVTIVVWGVNRLGKRIQKPITKRDWPTKQAKKVLPQRPAKRARDAAGRLP